MSTTRERLPLQALPAWMSFNDAFLDGVAVQHVEPKGHGLVAQTGRHQDESQTQPPLATIPHELVLNQEAVQEYAKEDGNFKALLDACGHKSPRHDILLFLLVHLVAASRPWTEYLKLLDDQVPLPTMWPDGERDLLRGTSLEVRCPTRAPRSKSTH